MDMASRIDHANLKAEAAPHDIDRLVTEALEHRFAAVCVHGRYVGTVAQALRSSPLKTCAVVGFPLGASKPMVKAIEATAACKDGAEEIDFVAHLPHLLARDVAAAKAEFVEIIRAARSVRTSVVVKVIIESALLTAVVDDTEAERRIASACIAARESGCDFVKTSTGFHPAGGAAVDAVKLIRKHAGPLHIKASGGIRTYDDANRMIEAGADRIGCSSSVAILHGAEALTGTD